MGIPKLFGRAAPGDFVQDENGSLIGWILSTETSPDGIIANVSLSGSFLADINTDEAYDFFTGKEKKKMADETEGIFIAIIVEKPFKKEQEAGERMEIICEPFVVIADNEDDAVVQAMLKKAEDPALINAKKRKLKVFVRPF